MIHIGNSSNSPCNVLDMSIGDSDNKPRRIIKAWIGDANNTPRLFWGASSRPKSIYSFIYPNANVYAAGTVSVNNGNRSPVTKAGAGDAVVFCVRNGSGSEYGGNWLVTVCIALTPEAALLTAPNIGAGTSSYTINGITYYVGGQGTNASWGGATTISSPIGVPIFDDWLMWRPNYSMSEATLREILQRLKIYPYYPSAVPDMTSNNTPYGAVTASSGFAGYTISGSSASLVNNSEYFAFDGRSDTAVLASQENITGYVQYTFDEPISVSQVVVTACKITMYSGRDEPFTVSVKSNGSWSTFGNFTITEHNGLNYVMKDYTVNGTASNVTDIRISNDIAKVYGYNIAIAGVKVN